MNFDASDSAVVHGFQAFYYELLRHKERALSMYCSQGTKSLKPGEEAPAGEAGTVQKNEAEVAVVSIQKKMIKVIENVVSVMLAKSRIAQSFIGDAKYIMTVLADEIFLNLKWDGAAFWRFTLLEKQLFQTEVAGDRFFTMADDVIVDVRNEDMAFLYLMALSLGFKGKYRGAVNADEQISWYKNRLYAMLSSHQSKLFFPGRTHMICSCYEYTNFDSDNSSIPDHRFWAWCIASIIMAYIVISYIVWCGITGEISDVLKQISEQTRQGPLL
ncbi:MAG: DotU family type IV/VI secretion system protein [Holosporales bacterium]|jgi:type VI secretion system protein ImpK|nr:DotU family type IV/VI secretion system protein [Holosporales bacterium]